MFDEFIWSVVLWALSAVPFVLDALAFAAAVMCAVAGLYALATAARALWRCTALLHGDAPAWAQDPRRAFLLALGAVLIFGMGFLAARSFAHMMYRTEPSAAALGCVWYISGLLVQLVSQRAGRSISAWWRAMDSEERLACLFFSFCGPAAIYLSY